MSEGGEASKERRQQAALAFRTTHYDRPNSTEDPTAGFRRNIYDLDVQNTDSLQTSVDDEKGALKEINPQVQAPKAEGENVQQMVTEAMHSNVDAPDPTLKKTSADSDATTPSHKTNDSQDQGSSHKSHNQILPDTPHTTTSINTEPFPDYYESCEGDVPVVDKAHEEAYNYAISKVVEEVIRFKEVDSNITALAAPAPAPVDYTTDSVSTNASDELHPVAATSSQGSKNQPENNLNNSSKEAPEESTDAYTIEDDRGFLRPQLRQGVIEEMRELTNNPQLKCTVRKRFIAMCNMIINMERIMFRWWPHPSDPLELITGDDCIELRRYIVQIMEYVSRLRSTVMDDFNAAICVRYVVGELVKENGVSDSTMFSRISQVLMGAISKPRKVEFQLLKVFVDFFGILVYHDFYVTYRRRPKPRRGLVGIYHCYLSCQLNALWCQMGQLIEAYDAIVQVTEDIKTQHLDPIILRLSRASPEEQAAYQREKLITSQRYPDHEPGVEFTMALDGQPPPDKSQFMNPAMVTASCRIQRVVGLRRLAQPTQHIQNTPRAQKM